jgi:Mrp family chromosome partitioning ATPase
MLLLHHRIEALLPEPRRRIIHFTAARPAEGTSTIVRGYGTALAETLGRSVLIVEANEHHPDQHVHFGVTPDTGWDDVLARGEDVERAIYRTALPNLSVSPFSARAAVPSVFDGEAVARVFARLRDQFDAVLVDSSPVLRPGAVAVSAQADGVVLVVEADRTRWPVVVEARQSIERSGGTVLGVVLNKRRHHIPASIYRWL